MSKPPSFASSLLAVLCLALACVSIPLIGCGSGGGTADGPGASVGQLIFGLLAAPGVLDAFGVQVTVLDQDGNPLAGQAVTLSLDTNPGAVLVRGSRQYAERFEPNLPSILDPLPAIFNYDTEISGLFYDAASDTILVTNTDPDLWSMNAAGTTIAELGSPTVVTSPKGFIIDAMGRYLTGSANEATDADIYEIDPMDGSSVSLGAVTYPDTVDSFNGFATDPTTGTHYCVIDSNDINDDERNLCTFDPTTLTATKIGVISEDGAAGGDGCASIAFLPDGQMYMISGENDVIETMYTVDKATAATAIIMQLGMDDDGESLTSQPARLRGTLAATSDAGGVATFSGLALDAMANGYTLRATSGATSVVSPAFNVGAPDMSATVSFASPASAVSEGSSASIDVTISAAQTHPIFLQLILSGTADTLSAATNTRGPFPTDDFDMPGFPGVGGYRETFVTIPAGTTTFTITVDAIADALVEGGGETLILTIGNTESTTGGIGLAMPGAQLTHTLTIND